MSAKEEEIEKLDKEVKDSLSEISKSLMGNDYANLNAELDARVNMLNESFLKEVRSFSLTAVTAAPFSLTLLMSGLDINKTYLILSFVLMMMDVLFLNIGLWHVNTKFGSSTFSQKLEAITMDVQRTEIINENKQSTERLNALYELMQSETRLKTKKTMEPYKQQKILRLLRDWGILLLSLSIVFLILSVISQNIPKF